MKYVHYRCTPRAAGLAEGKVHNAALVACARRLVIYANAVVQPGTPWTEKGAWLLMVATSCYQSRDEISTRNLLMALKQDLAIALPNDRPAR
jgi:hypothetical protein